MNREEMLAALRESGALLSGHFELRSGLHSGEYFQCAILLQNAELAGKVCGALADAVRAASGGRPVADSVIAPALGGLIVGHEVARALGARFIFAEKEAGKLVLRRGFKIRAGERFVVAEDVVTRGGRVLETIAIVEQAGGRVEAVAALVDRSGGKVDFKRPFFSLLSMEPVVYQPSECPLCARGEPMAHPGS